MLNENCLSVLHVTVNIYRHTKIFTLEPMSFLRVVTLSIPLCRFRNRALCSFLSTKEHAGAVHFTDVLGKKTDEASLRLSQVFCARATSFTEFTHGFQVSYCELST